MFEEEGKMDLDYNSSYDFEDTSNDFGNDSCQSYVEMESVLHWSLVPSVLIILLLSFLERHKRITTFDKKVRCLSGRFGTIVPLDLVGTFSNRWTFGFAFGAIANTIMNVLLEDYLPVDVPNWAKAFVFLIASIEVGVSYYPIFTCFTTSHKIVGSIIGFFYSLAWLAFTTVYIVRCPNDDVKFHINKIMIYWPSMLSLTFLVGQFFYTFIKSCRMLGAGHVSEEECFLQVHQDEHVKRLLRKPVNNPKSWFQRKIYDWDPCFKFPSRMIFTSVLALFCLYIFATLQFALFAMLMSLLKIIEDKLLKTDYNPYVIYLTEFNDALNGSFIFGSVLTCIYYVLCVMHILVCYRKHIRKLRMGDKGFLAKTFHTPDPSFCVASVGQYVGWQVAYILWGFQTMLLVLFLIGIIFVYLIVYPLKHGKVLEFLDKWGFVVLTFVIIIILYKLQIYIATMFFIQKKINPEDKQKPIALDNRKAYHNFNYFILIYNVFLGFGAGFSRLLYSLGLGTCLVARIDRSILQRGFESMDKGYKTWIGMLYMDHYHTNPVLVSFCDILLRMRAEKRARESNVNCDLTKETGTHVSSQARTRWFLAYTLIKNPRIIMNRKVKELEDPETRDIVLQTRLLQASMMEAEIRN
ncbi:stimulated by retinoic acid gene 6 protein-like [Discoglossus pictus]